MKQRTLIPDPVHRSAVFSDDRKYRYVLKRIWNPLGGLLNFVMLNPSTADEVVNDPTVERCERRARTTGYGGLVVTNIFAWRSTDPAALRRVADPVGPENDRAIIAWAQRAEKVVCAWGNDGMIRRRAEKVRHLFYLVGIDLWSLGLNKATGEPRHPLYVSYADNTQPYCRGERVLL
jgi:hypothetical protein